MRQHIYPGASLVVIDVAGSVAADPESEGTASSLAATEQTRALGTAARHAQRRCDPVIIAHRFQSTVRVDLLRDGECYGWIELTVRAAKDALLKPGVATRPEHSSYSHTQVDLDLDPQFRLRYLLPRAQKMSKVGARYAKAQPLDVTPHEEVRLLLRSGGQRRALTVCSATGQPLLQIGISASSTLGTPARELSALLGVRATSINVYDFGSPPTSKLGVRGPRGMHAQQGVEHLSR